jgi:hypothetical protein
VKLELYQRVSLTCDLPEHRLQRGDVATLVDHVPHPNGEERGCVLEIFNAVGESIRVLVVPESVVEPLRADEVMMVRSIASSA